MAHLYWTIHAMGLVFKLEIMLSSLTKGRKCTIWPDLNIICVVLLRCIVSNDCNCNLRLS